MHSIIAKKPKLKKHKEELVDLNPAMLCSCAANLLGGSPAAEYQTGTDQLHHTQDRADRCLR